MLKIILFILILFLSPVAYCACTISTSGTAFGAYNPLSSANNDSVGNIALTCSNGSNYNISLSKGNATTYNPRQLKSGSNSINYNLYTTTTRNIIWGDGTSSTRVVSGTCNGNQCNPRNISVYGRIPGSQDAAVANNYSDNITVTVNF